MSLATGFLQAPVNGLPPRPTEVNEALEYKKILGIYNQVIAGSHPRLKLFVPINAPARAILDQIPSQLPIPPAGPSHSEAETVAPSTVPLLPLRNNVRPLPAIPPSLTAPTFSSRPVSSKPPASELDPIFLTKSDDLVRAEIQLQRQRVERVLREQMEQKRLDARHKPSFAEAKPDFDVADVLSKAMARVKPAVFDEPRTAHENGSSSDSFDENSFYSSKAPDSAPHEGDGSQKSSLSKHQVQPVDKDDLDADRLLDRRSDEIKQVDLTDSPYRVIPRPDLSTTLRHPQYGHETERTRDEGTVLASTAVEEDDDEPEYYPPEPLQSAHMRDVRGGISGDAYVERGRRVSGRQSKQHQYPKRYESPIDADMRIVRSHITSPIAPQPSRVSPLAVAKGPPLSQNRRHQQDHPQQPRNGGFDSERTSPDMAIATSHPRKKRKVQDGRKGLRKRTMASPDPIIKDEPVSPPPFHNVPPLGATRNRQASSKPIYIDVETAQEVRYVPEQPHRSSARSVVYNLEGQTPHSAPRVFSRAGIDDAPRPNQDLRRVVSVQHLPAREYVEPAQPTQTRVTRAPSYAVGEPVFRTQEARPFEGQPQTYERRQQAVEERPLPSPTYREPESVGHRYAIQSMAPPPQRRIVVDEYGQRFYETIHPARASVAPASGRRLDADSFNEVVPSRSGMSRAASVFEEFPRETRYVQQEMPPPQMIYRRVAEPARSATSDVRYVSESPRPVPSDVRYVTREAVDARPAPRVDGVQIYDYSSRQPVYPDDSLAPREPIMRVSSVRPSARPYEEPQEIFQRVQSVRPEARELSVFPEGRPQVRREHVQVDEPRYEIRRTAEGDRYYRIDDGGRIAMDGAAEGRPTYAARRY